MLKIYLNKDKKLGMMFFLFDSGRYVNDYNEFESQLGLQGYIRHSKTDIILANLERIVLLFEQDPELKHQLRLTAEERLRSCLEWACEQKDQCYSYPDKLKNLCKQILKTEKFMITLVDCAPDHIYKDVVMMWKIFYGFIRSEAKTNDKDVSS